MHQNPNVQIENPLCANKQQKNQCKAYANIAGNVDGVGAVSDAVCAYTSHQGII